MTGDIWKNLFSADAIDGIRVRMQRNFRCGGATSWIFVEREQKRQDSFGAVRWI